ncbi:hypothetical protein [Variovorax arabinosiphilus]|uniref:hypothetical protein n=1 Tax=Variovorax arabinosiphilus TaxID=3053498 RepID=UPI002576AAC2|nr:MULTISPECIES: hypothetical protein [unclassified Variovorax]MDM0121762.1 hypothetical protein [Variovorax sp. J2L1-78]MDM0130823.1 hypothetical protein [Variovorax sp. J2L1-63]MDM0234525.1 hypothetical protein [Variovorax sp. J2R1-6]
MGGFLFSAAAPVGAVVALMLVVWLLFAPALPGIVQFDDLGNLSNLNTITGLDSAWNWVRQGRAGPLGRPLALVTFALQHYEWPQPYALLLWNIALHIVNALLVLWLAVLVAQRLGAANEKQLAIGFLVALCWAILPLLNTSTLFIIQRMTLLSSTFMLAGLIAYLKVRGPVDVSWRRQLLALGLLAAFGVLALLTKENGALTVVYGLILELCVLTTRGKRKLSLVAIALILGCVLLLAKLAPFLSWASSTELQRGFTLPERLASQGILLLAYVKGLLVPSPSDLNPFRGYSANHGALATLWGMGLWAGLMLSPLFAWWRGWRLPALSLAWFFYGHIMESGWVPLELYFAHRNYLPAVGLVFGLVFGLLSLRQNTGLWRSVFVIYLVVLGGITWMNTSLWGDRELAAEIWAKEQPLSGRAAMNLAYELNRTQGLGAAQIYLDRFVTDSRDSAGLRLVGLSNACELEPKADHSKRVSQAKDAILTQPYEGWASDTVEKLMALVRKGGCPGLTQQQVADIAAAFLARPAYQEHRSIASNMLSIIGLVAMDQGNTRIAMDFYLQAIEHSATYAMANLYVFLAQQHPVYADLKRLRTAVEKAPLPRGTSQAEWEQLLASIDSQIKASPSSDNALAPS